MVLVNDTKVIEKLEISTHPVTSTSAAQRWTRVLAALCAEPQAGPQRVWLWWLSSSFVSDRVSLDRSN